MTRTNCNIPDGNEVKIKVNDQIATKRKKYHPAHWDDIPNDWKEVVDPIYRDEYNSDRRETRRNQSLYLLMERGKDFADKTVNIEE